MPADLIQLCDYWEKQANVHIALGDADGVSGVGVGIRCDDLLAFVRAARAADGLKTELKAAYERIATQSAILTKTAEGHADMIAALQDVCETYEIHAGCGYMYGAVDHCRSVLEARGLPTKRPK
jgi:uncharacterized protein with gpF-like domain